MFQRTVMFRSYKVRNLVLFTVFGLFSLTYLLMKLQILENWEEESENLVSTRFDVKDITFEEANFPLAFTMMVHRDPAQVVRLFRAIYRPHNLYCLHVDAKSGPALRAAVQRLATEHPHNVVLPKRPVSVIHSTFSVLEAELVCMRTLLAQSRVRWRYYINLTGQEWPLKTNLELVRILQQFNGSNHVEKIRINKGRIPESLGPPPHGIRIWKGAVHVALTRAFVEFALSDPRAVDLQNFLKKTLIPDETYFSTLNNDHSLKAPGGYSGDRERDPVKYPFILRHKIWQTEAPCHGSWLRTICIFGEGDLPGLTDAHNPDLFANKFVRGYNDRILDYMETWFYNRSRVVYDSPSSNPFINLTFYSSLAHVKYHY